MFLLVLVIVVGLIGVNDFYVIDKGIIGLVLGVFYLIIDM